MVGSSILELREVEKRRKNGHMPCACEHTHTHISFFFCSCLIYLKSRGKSLYYRMDLNLCFCGWLLDFGLARSCEEKKQNVNGDLPCIFLKLDFGLARKKKKRERENRM